MEEFNAVSDQSNTPGIQGLIEQMETVIKGKRLQVELVVTCLLAPATVIGGIFGMNFDIIPFAHHGTGFYATVGVMLVIPIIMIFIFKKRGWF